MTSYEVSMLLGMAFVTYLVRYPVLVLVSRIPLPQAVVDALRFIPVAVLTAIIVPAVLLPDGQTLLLSYRNSYLVAGVLSVLLAWYSKNLLLTIVVGMTFFLLWNWWM